MSTKYDLKKFLGDYKVEIPAIQRDYAFGRKEATTKRENFIKILNGAMSKKTIHLDFIYGKEENGKLLLLDGQQRITTLWLIAVYLAKINSESPEWLNNFTYNTRTSSREFCQALIKNDWNPTELDAEHKRFSTIWFYNSWKFDPTISGMVATLYTIDEIFSKTPQLTISDLQEITFSFLEIENLGQPEELYLKMNSRGKALTPFENFKANLLDLCKLNGWFDDDRTRLSVLSRKFDTTWTDIFWKNHSKEHEIDDIYLAFLTRFFLNEWIVNSNTKRIEKSEEFQSMYSYNEFTDFSIMNKMITKDSVVKLESILDNYSEENINKYLPEYQSAFDYIPVYTKDGISSLTQVNRVIFLAISNYLSKSTIEENSFKSWLRVVSNIVNNASIDNNVSMIGALRLINELSDHSQNIMEFLSKNPDLKSSVAEEQVNEEKQKAQRIILNPNAESSINEAEDCDFFSGRIRDLIDVDAGNGEFNWDTFSLERYRRWDAWFEKGNPSNLFRRALLAYTKGEGKYPNVTWRKSDNLWIELNLGKDNWNTILNDNKNSIRKFIDGYRKNYFENIINNFEDQSNLYYLLIKNEVLFNDKYIDDERVIIKDKKQLLIRIKGDYGSKTWSKPETILLFEKLTNVIPNLKFNHGAAGDDESREARLQLKITSEITLETKYIGDKYQLVLFQKEDSQNQNAVLEYWNSREKDRTINLNELKTKYVYYGSEKEVTDIMQDFAE